jgi:hypothetical protein
MNESRDVTEAEPRSVARGTRHLLPPLPPIAALGFAHDVGYRGMGLDALWNGKKPKSGASALYWLMVRRGVLRAAKRRLESL